MNSPSNRVKCAECGANNFISSAVCWQCGHPLQTDQTGGQGTSDNIRTEQNQPVPPVTPPPPTGGPTPPSAYPPSTQGDTQTLIILGYIFAGLGIFCCVFSITAIVMGAIASGKGDKRGLWVILTAIGVLVIGIVIGIVATPFYTRWMTENFPNPGQMPGNGNSLPPIPGN